MQACIDKKRFSARIDRPHLDKFVVEGDLKNTVPTKETVPYARLNDLLREGERLGGVCLKVFRYRKFHPEQNLLRRITENDYHFVYGKIVGIVDGDENAKGYILYNEGPGIRSKTKGVNKEIPSSLGVLSPMPVHS